MTDAAAKVRRTPRPGDESTCMCCGKPIVVVERRGFYEWASNGGVTFTCFADPITRVHRPDNGSSAVES